MKPSSARSLALVELGRWLAAHHYSFITPTPLTHARVLRGARRSKDPLRDAFGWSRPFAADLLPRGLTAQLRDARLIVPDGEGYRSQIRFSTLGSLLLSHSAFPTREEDSVFFGPDTYRFARFIVGVLDSQPLPEKARIVDIGCGGGAGGLVAARACRMPVGALVLADINPLALEHACANALLAGLDACCVHSDLYAGLEGDFDLIVSNPPYLVDEGKRVYRDGGGHLGGGLSQRIVDEGLDRLAPGGRLLLYTGAAIEDGRDAMREFVERAAGARGWDCQYEEIDPDVFGEELETPPYSGCDRIAAIGAVIRRPCSEVGAC